MNFTTTILNWFCENSRALPWRETNDPYAIWLSEIILQQTRIEQGLPYWQRFMQRWHTIEELAAASEDEVLREWQGLGYYSRARNLHTAAKQVVEMGGFTIPLLPLEVSPSIFLPLSSMGMFIGYWLVIMVLSHPSIRRKERRSLLLWHKAYCLPSRHRLSIRR